MFIERLTSTHLDFETLTQKYYFYLKEDLYYWQRQLFPICNCSFGIWLNFDAVLRYSRATMCVIAVFVPPLRPPLRKLRENSRETVSISTICNKYCRNIGVLWTFMSISCYSLPYARQASTTFYHLRNISRIKKYISRHTPRKQLCMLLLLPDWTSVFHFCREYRNKLSRYFSMFKM